MSSDKDVEQKPRGISTEECQRMVDRAVNRDPVVRFMLEKLDEVRAAGVLYEMEYHMPFKYLSSSIDIAPASRRS